MYVYNNVKYIYVFFVLFTYLYLYLFICYHYYVSILYWLAHVFVHILSLFLFCLMLYLYLFIYYYYFLNVYIYLSLFILLWGAIYNCSQHNIAQLIMNSTFVIEFHWYICNKGNVSWKIFSLTTKCNSITQQFEPYNKKHNTHSVLLFQAISIMR